ncbi:hypothetical protein AK830_g6551 [Neonectria ditissima]|uniref:DUF7892 domain-containing protein n=1 Tax=Neonectria ditissima TaxID=78410 RepID=A0A0P7BG42_9HYPO|nr:hypothetical protein AK830_g6551 [Neonectria ditissima]
MLTQLAQVDDDRYSPDISKTADGDAEPTNNTDDIPTAILSNEPSTPNGPPNNKRKPSASTSPTQPLHAKRVRIDEDEPGSPTGVPESAVDRAHQLPAEIWHHIFTFLPPRALGRLLSVNKLFHTCLQPCSSVSVSPHHSASHTALQPLKPDLIWQTSRRLFWPRMPAPLKGKSELEMWRLACSLSCQFCSLKGDLQNTAASDQWHRGPGAKGVSPIFPFSVSTCGSCFTSNSVKEIDVLLSSSIPTLLLPALPVVFVTDELHVIPPQVMQAGISPSISQITKVFWSHHLEQIKSEFETVKLLGSAAAEEWVKGLEIRGKKALADASRWEKWDLAGGLHRMQTCPSYVSPALAEPTKTNGVGASSSHPSSGHSAENHHQNHGQAEHLRQPSDQNGTPTLRTKSDASNIQPRPQGQQRRTKEQVTELKTKRRTEIERRALLLDPPLPPSVLAHIPSFQAALQIITPLDDNAWELLKPRLLAQREKAESRGKELNTNTRAIKEKLEARKKNAPVSNGLREVADKDWDEIQGPLRARISNFADEIIRDGWGEGDKVKKKNCQQFAAEVLLYVRKRFYAEVAKDTAAALAVGLQPTLDPPEGPWTQKLTLENMKWVFDFKIKPHTEAYRKELFLCNSCVGNPKYYGFEGVIQHYAAKHTNALSVGSVVVHWRAEWPEVPPFSPDPRPSGNSQISQPPNTSNPSSITQPHQNYAAFSLGPPAGYPTPGYEASLPHHQFGSAQHAPFQPANFHEPGGPSAYGALQHPPPYAPDGDFPSYPPTLLNGVPFTGLPSTPYPDSRGPYDDQPPADSYKMRLKTMIKVAKETWLGFSGAKDLPAPVKIYVLLRKIAEAFRDEYSQAAPLAMFIDGLSKHREMRSIRNTNGLWCKACWTNVNPPKKTNFSLPQLASHFNKQHIASPESRGLPPMDWQVDMVLLPDPSALRGLEKSLRNHRPACDLVASALPWLFDESHPEYPSTKQPWPLPMDPPLNGTKRKSDDDHHARPRDYQTRQHKSDVPRANRKPPGMERPRHGEYERTEGEAPKGQVPPPTHIPDTRDVPNLRPASEIYSKADGAGPAMQGRYVHKVPSQKSPRSNVNTGRETTSTNQDVVLNKGREVQFGHMRSSSPHDYQRPHVRDDRRLDYRDIESQRYANSEPHPPERTRPLNERWAEPWRGGGTLEPPPPTTVAPRLEDDGFGLLGALESHLERAHEEIIYVDPSGRELGRATRPLEPHHNAPWPYHNDQSRGPDMRRFPQPPQSGSYPSDYQERGLRPRYPPQAYHHEAEPAPRRAYYDPPPEPPIEAYELVEVRDPRGDYFIKRPIRRDLHDSRAYEPRPAPAPRDTGAYPPYEPVDDHENPRMVGYTANPRPASLAQARPNVGTECEDYDPRYPATGSGEPVLRQGRH